MPLGPEHAPALGSVAGGGSWPLCAEVEQGALRTSTCLESVKEGADLGLRQMKKEQGHDHRLVDRTLSPVQEQTVTQPEASASASQGSEAGDSAETRSASFSGRPQGPAQRLLLKNRAQVRGMCGREDTATLMKNWKCKH